VEVAVALTNWVLAVAGVKAVAARPPVRQENAAARRGRSSPHGTGTTGLLDGHRGPNQPHQASARREM
jgi:hypothetical protein